MAGKQVMARKHIFAILAGKCVFVLAENAFWGFGVKTCFCDFRMKTRFCKFGVKTRFSNFGRKMRFGSFDVKN